MLTTCVMRKNMDNLFQVDIKTRLCCSPSCQPRCCKCCNNVVENLFKGVTVHICRYLLEHASDTMYLRYRGNKVSLSCSRCSTCICLSEKIMLILFNRFELKYASLKFNSVGTQELGNHLSQGKG